jgi:hypothetical protein
VVFELEGRDAGTFASQRGLNSNPRDQTLVNRTSSATGDRSTFAALRAARAVLDDKHMLGVARQEATPGDAQ